MHQDGEMLPSPNRAMSAVGASSRLLQRSEFACYRGPFPTWPAPPQDGQRASRSRETNSLPWSTDLLPRGLLAETHRKLSWSRANTARGKRDMEPKVGRSPSDEAELVEKRLVAAMRSRQRGYPAPRLYQRAPCRRRRQLTEPYEESLRRRA